MTRFRHGAAISLVAVAGQQLAGAPVLVVAVEQPSRGQQPRGKVEVGQPLLPVAQAELFVFSAGGDKTVGALPATST